MKIKVNEQFIDVPDAITLATLVSDILHCTTPVALAVNDEFVPNDLRGNFSLQEGDKVMIISAAFGG